MRFKDDWPEARERLTALWEGCRLDRPCMAVTAPSGKDVKWPPPPATAEQKWMDPDWIVPNALASMESTWWGGEAIPSYLLQGGWVVCLGGTPRFDANTIWFEPMTLNFDAPPSFPFNPASQWVKRHEKLYSAVADAAGKDGFLLGTPCHLPANDLLSMLMGTDRFLLSLMDHADWMRAAIIEGARHQIAAAKHLRRRVADRHEFWYGNAGWMPFWAPEPYCATQSDVSCMLSPDMYEQFVLPEIELYAREIGPLWYHLDGGDARQHLPRLLSLPCLRVIQYTPTPSEPPNGPAHLDFYRRIQSAGKIVHIQLPKENVEPLVKSLDPGLLMLDAGCSSIEEGQSLLTAAKGWTRTQTRSAP